MSAKKVVVLFYLSVRVNKGDVHVWSVWFSEHMIVCVCVCVCVCEFVDNYTKIVEHKMSVTKTSTDTVK